MSTAKTNILTRVHAESTSNSTTLQIQEGEIHKLARVLGKASNTIIPKEWIHSNYTLHQAHLERISDFVLCGPGVWWQDTPAGIEFFDGDAGPSSHSEGPILHHFRSASLADIDFYLHQKWEECCSGNIQLPAKYIRQYQSDGSLGNITIVCCSQSPSSSKRPGKLSTPSSPQTSVQPKNTVCVSLEQSAIGVEYPRDPTLQPTDASIPPTCCIQDSSQPLSTALDELPQSLSTIQVPHTFKTTLGRTLSQVLPQKSTLKQFHMLKSKMKQTKVLRNDQWKQLSNLSPAIKHSLIDRYRDLHSRISQESNLGQEAARLNQPKRDVEHTFNIVRKILQYEWRMDIGTLSEL